MESVTVPVNFSAAWAIANDVIIIIPAVVAAITFQRISILFEVTYSSWG